MFGRARNICGVERMFPVQDRVLLHDVINVINSCERARVVYRLSTIDMQRINSEPHMLALNPSGHQCHLLITRVYGRGVTLIVDAKANAAHSIPLRFASQLHDENVVLRCIACYRKRILVINDVCDGTSWKHRVQRIHSIVHDDHTPDAFLFPLQLVCRRLYMMAQLSEVKAVIEEGEMHSLSVISGNDFDIERRVTFQRRVGRVVKADDAILAVGDRITTQVSAGITPDSYSACVRGEIVFVSIRSIGESAFMRSLDWTRAQTMELIWTGAAWVAAP